MKERIEYDKSLKKYVKALVKVIRSEAVPCQIYSVKATDTVYTSQTVKKDQGNDRSEKGSSAHGKNPNNRVCLYPPHAEKGLKHLLRDCRSCPEEEMSKRLAKFKAEKAEKRNKGAKRVGDHPKNQKPENSV